MYQSLSHLFSRSWGLTPFSKYQSGFNQAKGNKKVVRNGQLKLSSIIAVMALGAVPAMAQEPKAVIKKKLVVGSEVNTSALNKAVWLKGGSPESFEPGKVYIIECWATWCPPCVASIPHVNELHEKYYDKGLRVMGMSVWEGDQKKVQNFLTKKGDGMAYAVAYTGEESAFSREWLDAAGVTGIPHAFIVRNGILLGSTQVSRLTNSLIESLLSGDAGAKEASDILLEARGNQAKTERLVKVIEAAGTEGNADKMMESLEELKAIDPNHPEVLVLELKLLITRRDWPAAIKALKSLPKGESKDSFVSGVGIAILANQYPHSEEFKVALAASYKDYVMLSQPLRGPNHFGMLSNILWNMGDKEGALSAANKAIEAAKSTSRYSDVYTISYTRFAKAVKEGHMADRQERSKWFREAVKQLAEEK